MSEASLPAEPVSPPGAQKIATTVGYYLTFVVLGLITAVLGPTLLGLAGQTHTQISTISLIFPANSLGYLLGSLLGGRVYDRSPGHPLLAGTLLSAAVILALIPLAPLLGILLLLMIALGLSQAILDVGGNTLLVWVHRDKVAPFMNGLHFFFGVGAAISPLIIAWTAGWSGGITWGYWILALLVVPLALWPLFLASPTAQTSTREEQAPTRTNYVLVALMASLLFFYVGAEWAFGGWIFTYAVVRELTTSTDGAYLTSFFWGTLTLGRLISIPLAARIRPRLILLGDLLGYLTSLGIILIWSNSLMAVWVGTAVMGLSMASVFPTVLNLAERRLTLTAHIMSWFFVGSSLGSLLAWLIGQMFESIGPQVMMWMILVDLLLMLGVFFVTITYSERGQRKQA